VCTVLIVDDHADIREMVCELVAAEGHTAHEAANGQDALDWLVKQTITPCLILLDLRMPVLDGWDFLRAMRATRQWVDVPVIVLSATIKPGAGRPLLSAVDFWPKPPEPHRIAAIHRYCDDHRLTWRRPTDVIS
jgi:CheY-like chemotaxis protein